MSSSASVSQLDKVLYHQMRRCEKGGKTYSGLKAFLLKSAAPPLCPESV